jgi:hypothetical protein
MEVELVFSLVKNDGTRTIDHICRYLLTPVCR